MTIEEQIDEELRNNCTMLRLINNRNIWISKTEEINYKDLYEAIAKLNINRSQRVMEDGSIDEERT